LPSWELTEWQAYYEVTDWIQQGLGKENDYRRGLAFAQSVQAIEEERHERKTGRKVGQR
jgi:hypothetical protein